MERSGVVLRATQTTLAKKVLGFARSFWSNVGRGAAVASKFAWVAGIAFWIVGYPLLRARDRSAAYDDAVLRASVQREQQEQENLAQRRENLRHV